jgi:hypothetical protein
MRVQRQSVNVGSNVLKKNPKIQARPPSRFKRTMDRFHTFLALCKTEEKHVHGMEFGKSKRVHKDPPMWSEFDNVLGLSMETRLGFVRPCRALAPHRQH